MIFGLVSTAFASEDAFSVPEMDDATQTFRAKTAEDSSVKLQKLCQSGEFEAKFDQVFVKKEEQLSKKRDLVDQSLEKKRALRDQQRVEKDNAVTESLSEKNPERLSIHQEFKSAIDSAITTRRNSVNQNIANFRTSVNSINAAAKTKILAAISTLKAEACANGASGEKIKSAWETFQSSIKSIRQQQLSEKSISKASLRKANQDGLKVLKTSVESANQKRKSELEELQK